MRPPTAAIAAISLLSLCVGPFGSSHAGESKQLERLRVGNLCLYHTAHGPTKLLYNGEPLIEGMYFYTAVKSASGRMIEGFNFRRNEDGFMTFGKEEIAGGQRLTWYNKRHVRERPTRPKGKLAGEGTLTLTLTGDGITVRCQGTIEPNPGFGEIGFYVHEDALTRGTEGRFVARFPNGSTQDGALPLQASKKRNILHGPSTLTFETPQETHAFTFTGTDFAGSNGLHFQDFRRNDRRLGCYRIVLGLSTKAGSRFDYTWRLRIRPKQSAAEIAQQSATGSKPTAPVQEIRLRPAIKADVQRLPQPRAAAAPDRGEEAALRVDVDDGGQITVTDAGQPVVQSEYFRLFSLGAPKREETRDDDVRRISLHYDTPKGSLTKEAVVSPDDVWLLSVIT